MSPLALRQLVAIALLLSLASPFTAALPTLQARDGALVASDILAAVSQELVQAVNPQTSARTVNSTSLSKKAVLPAYYSTLVAFGASYTDNAHARAAQYSSSLRNFYPYNKFGGRYSNGKVGVEWMVESSTSPALKRSGAKLPKLLDYAYGGSVVQNGLSGTGSSSPAAVDQISAYLSDVKSGSAALGSGRVLHYFNSGINSQYQIWNAALSAGLGDTSIANAKAATSAQVSALAAAIRTMKKSSALASKTHGADYLLVGLPALEIVPTSAYQVPIYFSAAKKAKALNLLKTITAQYNDGLKSFAAQLKTEVKGAGGRVYFYDLASLWYDLHRNPKSYGITTSPVTKTCYDSKTGSLCTDPSAYLYFDTLHPVTSVHAVIAKKVNALVLGL